MKNATSGIIHALEFDCQAPLKFYEHCFSCPRFKDDCPDLALGVEILRKKKKLVYDGMAHSEDSVNAGAFNCLAPLNYFEKTRMKCAHEGRCREEGLLIALLRGRKELDYSQKAAIDFPRVKIRRGKTRVQEGTAPKVAVL
jgi:hypothetical protein